MKPHYKKLRSWAITCFGPNFIDFICLLLRGEVFPDYSINVGIFRELNGC